MLEVPSFLQLSQSSYFVQVFNGGRNFLTNYLGFFLENLRKYICVASLI
jgi:hypothetical protein